MDPYLEDRWQDVHHSLVQYARNQLQPQVMPKYRARVDERVVLDADEDRRPPTFEPDVKIVRRPSGTASPVPMLAGVSVADPLVVLLPQPEEVVETFLQIIDPKTGGTVVTVIEFLSPSNKRPGKDLDAYLAKQYELKRSDVSLVEIDLLRAGTRATSFPFDLWPRESRRHYAACVARPTKRRQAELYGFDLRRRLPAIRVPLRDGDPDVILDLQPLVDQAFIDGGYDGDLEYARPPVPPLSSDDEAWSDALLRAAGKRG